MATVLLHKFYTGKQAIKRIHEIMDRWKKMGYNTPNEVPPTDKDISEYLQLMKSLGIVIKYKHYDKLKEVV